MKLLNKNYIIFTAIWMVLGVGYAQSTGSAGGSKSTSGTPSNAVTPGTNTTTTNVTNPSNPNNTGTSVYDNRTGAPLSGTGKSGVVNQKTKTTTQPNAAVTQSITLDGVRAEDNARVIQLARDAGASDARMEGNILKYSGESFNQARFKVLMSNSLPSVNLNQ